MTERDWIMLVAGLVGGGAMGAVINGLWANYRNRRQPVGYSQEVIKVFSKNLQWASLQATLTLTDEQSVHQVDNLFITRLTIVNRGNQDIAEFKFGMTLAGADKAILVKAKTPDRHHSATLLTPISIGAPSNEIDYMLKPFNRNSPYSFNVFIVVPGGESEPGAIEPGSPHSTQFVPLPLFSDRAKQTLVEIIAGVVEQNISLKFKGK